MKIEAFKLGSLRNEEHCQFFTEFKALADATTPAALGITTEYSLFLPLYADELAALDIILKSATTDELTDADILRDETASALPETVKSFLRHFNPAKRDAATRLMVVFDSYGRIAVRPYDEETAAINSLLADLTAAPYAADIATLGLADWLTELKLRNDNFAKLMKTRYTEDAGKTQLRMKEVRVKVDASYRQIVEKIKALIVVNGEAKYKVFVGELNQRIEKYKNQLAIRKGRNEKKA